MTEGWGLKRNKKYLKKIETSNNLWFSSRLAKPALERTRLAAYLHFRMEWTPQVVFTKMRLLKLMSLNEYINFCGSGLWVVLHTRQGESQRCPDLVMPLRYYEEPKWKDSVSWCGIKSRKYHQSGFPWQPLYSWKCWESCQYIDPTHNPLWKKLRYSQ